MAEEKEITVEARPETAGKAEVNLIKSDFDALIEQKGYDVYHDHSIKCPCSSSNGGASLTSCKNCNGSGWFYVNRTKTRMVIQSMNLDTKTKEWSEEKLGTAKITAREEEKLSFMDRVILIDSRSELSEVIFLKAQPDEPTKLYGIVKYNIIEAYSVFLFMGESVKHRLLVLDEDYTIDRNQIKLVDTLAGSTSPTISVRYTHSTEYTILDLSRDVIVSPTSDDCSDGKEDLQYPVLAIARQSHYIVDRNNYTNSDLLDNSFDT